MLKRNMLKWEMERKITKEQKIEQRGKTIREVARKNCEPEKQGRNQMSGEHTYNKQINVMGPIELNSDWPRIK
jgi:hypothetical protein